MTDVDRIRGHIQHWDQGAWCLAALALGLGGGAAEEQAGDVRRVLDALGVEPMEAVPDGALRAQLAAQASAPLLQVAALLTGRRAWLDLPDEALVAQGRTSAQSAPVFAQFVLGQLDGLAERFAAPGCRMLDVGTGVGAMAVAYAEVFPQLSVVGIDVLPRVLELARRTVADSPAGARVELREQDVAALDDVGSFDLAWIPSPFIPEGALRAGLPRITAAVRAGGWVMLGHGKFGNDALENALTALKTRAYGGTPLEASQARQLLGDAGLVGVSTLETPPGAPALTVGRRD